MSDTWDEKTVVGRQLNPQAELTPMVPESIDYDKEAFAKWLSYIAVEDGGVDP